MELIKFPCTNIDRKNKIIVDISECFDCQINQSCDIYATMLDETNEINKNKYGDQL